MKYRGLSIMHSWKNHIWTEGHSATRSRQLDISLLHVINLDLGHHFTEVEGNCNGD